MLINCNIYFEMDRSHILAVCGQKNVATTYECLLSHVHLCMCLLTHTNS